jgi:uncharacterized membrane protein YbhN (UPF0104 family)
LLGAIANIGFDMLTLYFLFVAAGHNVSLGILFAGYGLPLMLAMVGLTALYVLATELAKKYFYSKLANANA